MGSRKIFFVFDTTIDIIVSKIIYAISQQIENENKEIVHLYDTFLQKAFYNEFSTSRYQFLNTGEKCVEKSREIRQSFIILKQDIDIITMYILNDIISTYINFEECSDTHYMYLSKTISQIISDCGGTSDRITTHHSIIAKKNDALHYEEYFDHKVAIELNPMDESI